MISIKITIESFSKETGRQQMTLRIEDFIKLNKVLNRLNEELNFNEFVKKNQANLNDVEQGLLINELCKRPGVQSLIVKKGCEYGIMHEDERKTKEKVGIGPANIIIISNDLEGGDINGKRVNVKGSKL